MHIRGSTMSGMVKHSVRFQYDIDLVWPDHSDGRIFINLIIEPLVQHEDYFVEPKKWKSEIQFENLQKINKILSKLQVRVSAQDGFDNFVYDLGTSKVSISSLANSVELRWQPPGPKSWKPIIQWHNNIIRSYFTSEINNEYLAIMQSRYSEYQN